MHILFHLKSLYNKFLIVIDVPINVEIDSIVSCNIHQTRFWRFENYGFCPINHNPGVLQQTQDLPKYYEENSLFYAFRSNHFVNTKMRIGNSPYFYETKFPENLDIDTEDDFKIAEALWEAQQ